MSRPQTVAFIGHLVWRFADLESAFAEHFSDNDGEVLPHVFMPEVERWAETLVSASPSTLSELLMALGDGYKQGNEEVMNLIHVSFVEHLPYPAEPNAEIRELLPPVLAELLRHGR